MFARHLRGTFGHILLAARGPGIWLMSLWPIRSEALLHDRLASMPVRLEYADDASSNAWRSDWLAAALGGPARREQL